MELGRLHGVRSQVRLWSAKTKPIAQPCGWRRVSSKSASNFPPPVEPESQARKNGRDRARKEERDLFLSVLSASTTKRDAKSYISQFTSQDKEHDAKKSSDTNSKPDYGTELPTITDLPLHISLIKIRELDILDESVLSGLVSTFSQLARLGIRSVIVLDSDENSKRQGNKITQSDRNAINAQADRLVSAIQHETPMNASRLDHVVGYTPISEESSPTVPVRAAVNIQFKKGLLEPLQRGLVPVIPPLAYTTETQRVVHVDADEVILALTREFAGLITDPKKSNDSHSDPKAEPRVVLDRVIILDPLGGLPSSIRADKAHIFVNLDQEARDIKNELLQGNGASSQELKESEKLEAPSVFGQSNPFTAIFEETDPILTANTPHDRNPNQSKDNKRPDNRHILNLELARKALTLLPPSSSALLTSPSEAATFSESQADDAPSLGVGTRTPKNPLIYNLLTDKPLFSSSLPVGRLSPSDQRQNFISSNRATFFKRGMPLTIIPDPRTERWKPPEPSDSPFSLTDPRIDFPRLLNLIEDSFNRPLDVHHYLERIQNRIAGVIVAGEYQGGAILTWELPPDVPDTPENAHRMVPYLDKFAVLKKSQGTGGVADIVFTAMVRSCFPDGVCWRSRKNNPVNKWYFERSVGTWKLPNSQWTMFWTTPGMQVGSTTFKDYEAVCRHVKPSWADKKNVPD